MRNSNRPAGPGTPAREERDSATAREELDELGGDTPADPTRPARQAVRDANVKVRARRDVPGPKRDRSRP